VEVESFDDIAVEFRRRIEQTVWCTLTTAKGPDRRSASGPTSSSRRAEAFDADLLHRDADGEEHVARGFGKAR
jgi:hypothetical protein